MDDKVDDGGPAFPQRERLAEVISMDPYKLRVTGEGMSIRDYFAAAALQGICKGAEVFWEAAPYLAYQYADAMLAARKRGK